MTESKRLSYRYTVFELIVESELEIPELPSSNELKSDVHIYFSNLQAMKHEIASDQFYRLEEERFILDVPKVARYQVSSGKRIDVDPENGAAIESVKLFLLGSCMGVLLHQRSILPMHGSVITDGKTGILLTGHSGAGKSTTAHHFLAKGYRLITDDVAATRFTDTEAIVAPAYGHQKLWEDVLQSSNIEYKRVNREVDGRTKYTVNREQQFLDSSVPLRLIVELIPAEVEHLKDETVTGIEKIRTLMSHMYRNVYFKELKQEATQFQMATELARRVKVIRIYRPHGMATQEAIIALITKEIQQGENVYVTH